MSKLSWLIIFFLFPFALFSKDKDSTECTELILDFAFPSHSLSDIAGMGSGFTWSIINYEHSLLTNNISFTFIDFANIAGEAEYQMFNIKMGYTFHLNDRDFTPLVSADLVFSFLYHDDNDNGLEFSGSNSDIGVSLGGGFAYKLSESLYWKSMFEYNILLEYSSSYFGIKSGLVFLF